MFSIIGIFVVFGAVIPGRLGVVIAALIGAVLFAAAHHLGPQGEPTDGFNFLFRVFAGLFFTLVSLLVNLALVAIAFCNAGRFTRWMGKQGLRGVSKIIALLLAAIAVSLIRRGWHAAVA